MEARVFVTQDTPFNITKAERYGKLVLLAGKSQEVSMIDGSTDNAAFLGHLRRTLLDFDINQDFVLPIGSPVLMALAFVTLGSIKGTQDVNILKWDGFERSYIPMRIRTNRG